MKKNPVSWKEGLFLLPHHFQQQDRYFEEQVYQSSLIDSPLNYGFKELHVDEDAFDAWCIQITNAKGRCKDGTIFNFGDGDLPRVDLAKVNDGEIKNRLNAGASIFVLLAFPTNQSYHQNVSANGAQSRFREVEEEVVDQSKGADEKRISFKLLTGELKFAENLETDLPLGYELLPAFRLRLKDSPAGAIPCLDETYFPPITNTKSISLATNYFRMMEYNVTRYLETGKEYLPSRASLIGIAAANSSDSVYRFFAFSELRTWLACHNQSAGFHPYQFFLFLCQMIGRFAITDPSDEKDWIPEIPTYDHDDAYQCIDQAWQKIKLNFVEPKDSPVKELHLKLEKIESPSGHSDYVLATHIDPSYFRENVKIYLGLYFGHFAGRDELVEFIKYWHDLSTFPWKMGSIREIHNYFRNNQKGVTTVGQPSPEREDLGRTKSYIYFDIDDDVYWDEVKESRTLCFKVDPRGLPVPEANLGEPDLAVIINRKSYKFKLTLFVVLPPQAPRRP